MTDSPSPEPVANMKSGDSPSTPPNMPMTEVSNRVAIESLEQIETEVQCIFGDTWNAPSLNVEAIRHELIFIRTLFSTLEGIDAPYTPQSDLKITSPEGDLKITSRASPSIQSSPPEPLADLFAAIRCWIPKYDWPGVEGIFVAIESRITALEEERDRLRGQSMEDLRLALDAQRERDELRAAFSSLKEDALTDEEWLAIDHCVALQNVRHLGKHNELLVRLRRMWRRLSQSRVTKEKQI